MSGAHGGPARDSPARSADADGPSATVQRDYEAMIRDEVAPALHAMGFAGTFREFRLKSGGHVGHLRMERHRRSTRQRLDFRIKVGAICMGTIEISRLLPGTRPSWWWRLQAGEPTGPAAESVISAVRDYALPALRAALEDPASEVDPAAVWRRSFPVVPRLSARASDGGGADPSAWWAQPAGTDLDLPLAELTSQIGLSRLGAVERVSDLAGADGLRVQAALLDRLERDPQPRIRRLIASRLLPASAQWPANHAALRETAAQDDDLRVRWAARYALLRDLRPG